MPRDIQPRFSLVLLAGAVLTVFTLLALVAPPAEALHFSYNYPELLKLLN